MPENKEMDEAIDEFKDEPGRIGRIATQIIEPALQRALGEAKNEAPPQEVLSALANCYAGLLIDLLGAKAASAFMRDHAEHVALREKQEANNQ